MLDKQKVMDWLKQMDRQTRVQPYTIVMQKIQSGAFDTEPVKFTAWDSKNNKMLSWNDIGWMEQNEKLSVHSLLSGEYAHLKPMVNGVELTHLSN